MSDHGRVRSVPRKIIMRDGRPKTIRGRVLAQHVKDKYGHMNVTLTRGDRRTRNRTAHALVAAAFIGPRPEGMDVRHLNGDPTDNRVENLAYGTRAENMLDMVRHGRNNVSKAECPRGHPYVGANVQRNATSGGRVCRSCSAAHSKIHRGYAERNQFIALADTYYRQFTGQKVPERDSAPTLPTRRSRGRVA